MTPVKLARTPHIEVILPVYNEVKNLLPLLKALDQTAAALRDRATVSYLFVNDGSTDGTTPLLYRLHKEREDLKVIDLVHNFGHGAAIAAGLDHFDGDIAFLMDADGQDAPDSLIPMFEAWLQGAKTVVAQRRERAEKNRLLFKAFYFLLHKVSRQLPPIEFGTHSLLDRSVVERIRRLPERHRYYPGLVAYASGRIHPIPLDRAARADGDSRVGGMGLLSLAITAFLNFSNAPIRLVSVLGMITSACGFTGGVTVVCVKLFTNWAIPGWASTIALVSFTSGVQLLCLGLIGEYLARVYDEVKGRPLYLVEKVRDRRPKAKAENLSKGA